MWLTGLSSFFAGDLGNFKIEKQAPFGNSGSLVLDIDPTIKKISESEIILYYQLVQVGLL